MDYAFLGRTGISVSRLCLGSMLFDPFGNPDADECVRMIREAMDAGVNFIDAADTTAAAPARRSWAEPWKGTGIPSCSPPSSRHR
jgi:predicted aldo/keto reductase-like oxidoreductase